jgi:hypothetical protein
MSSGRIAARMLVAASFFGVLSCTDSSAPSDPPVRGLTPSNERSPVAQDRLAALFPGTSSEVMALPGTVFADNDEVKGKLVFGVENANAAAGVRRVLEARGISANDYVIKETLPIVRVTTLQDRIRPTQAGTQIHFGNYVCSIGFNADFGTERSMYTASHCTNTQGGVEGTTYAQPLRSVDPTVIATEVADPEYTSLAGCSRGKVCRYSDASRSLYSADVASDRGVIAATTGVNNGSLTTSGTLSVTAQDNTSTSFSGDVDKVGRTTGWTRGTVTNSCVTVNVSGSNVQQLCQVIVTNPSATIVSGGDSGSGVFKVTSGTNVTLVGILWGGSGTNTFVFSPLKNVQDELGGLTGTVSGTGGGTGGGGGGGGGGCVPHGPNGNNCH